jgi:predicted DsbA family dithiol-disulfide isomerase
MPQNPAFVRRGEAARAQRLADHYGLTLHLRDRLLNSNLALQAVEHARLTSSSDPGAADRLHGALFDAFYRDQRDISVLEIVLEVARECATDAGLEEALRAGIHKELVARSRLDAHAQGVVAVPTWLYGGYGAVGIVDYSEYERLLEAPLAAPPVA